MSLSNYYNKETLGPILEQLRMIGSKLLSHHPDLPFTDFAIACEEQAPLFLASRQQDHTKEIRQKFQSLATPLFRELNLASTAEAIHQKDFHNPCLQKLLPKVAIIGAGSAGLLAGIFLNKLGCQVEIYEARSQHESMLRPQNISFKEAEERLRPMLGNDLYNRFFERAASMDGDTGKLRISIGAFQEVLTEELLAKGVSIHYQTKISLDDIKNGLNADVILLTTGVHTSEYFDIASELQPQVFPEFTAHGRTALYIRATSEPHGYQRGERDGYHWRRDNITIYDGKTVGYDLRRMIRNLEKYGDPHQVIPRLHELQHHSSVEYTFIFGNDTERFLEGLDTNPQHLIQQTKYDVIPMLSLNTVLHFSATPVVVLGDANGSPHPLAAIGTLKFIRNIQDYLPEFIYNHALFKHLALQAEPNQQLALEQLTKLNAEIYSLSAMKNIFEVFYQNILCGIYSKPR